MLNTKSFKKIELKEMEKVTLMNRTDRKYWFHLKDIQAILDTVNEDYFVLNIDGKSILPYATTYFDTDKNEMFANHHNGKLNRYKVRKRSYVSSGISFLEIKFKSNKGRTIKKRIPITVNGTLFSEGEALFLKNTSPYSVNDLKPSLLNNFSRITLVNKNFKERCTIDLNLHFKFNEKELELSEMVIVEIKSDGNSGLSPITLALRDHRIKTSGFSKYCVGRTIIDYNLKRNAFKAKIRSIEKMLQLNHKLYLNI